MDNLSIIKYTVVIATFPLWSKILKLLWDDMKDALREEGGLWGPDPHPRRVEEIRREQAAKDEILVHEPRHAGTRRDGFERPRERAAARGSAETGGRAGAPLRRVERRFGRRPR